MAWAVGQDVGNPLRKLVLMVLADEHRDDTDLCCPGLERIAAIGEMSTKSAARHIDALAELGKITVYKRGRSHGYILHCPPKADAVSNEAPEPALATPDSVSTIADSLSATPDSVSKTLDRESTEPGRTDSNRERTGGRARKSADRATRLPDDWQPSQADIDFALEEGLDDRHIQRTADRFRDHWHAAPGERGRKLDWSATWRNWVRKDADDARRDRAPPAGNAQTGSQSTGRRSQVEVKRDLRRAGFEAINGLGGDGPADRSGTGFSPAGPDSLPERGFTPRLAAPAGAE